MKVRAVSNPVTFYVAINGNVRERRPASACQDMDVFAESSDKAWLLVASARDGRHWWVRASDVEKKVLPGRRACMPGLHGRADGRLIPGDLRIVSESGLRAVKLLSTASSEDVLALQAIDRGMFILVRLFADMSSRRASPEDFCSWVVDDMRRFYRLGIRWFEVHNEPNLKAEGLDKSWSNGREFGAWFLAVRNNLKTTFPEALFGFPGLSPNSFLVQWRYDDIAFISEARGAVEAADWLGVHSYWQTRQEMMSDLGGMNWRRYRRLFPNKVIAITEFSNPSPYVGGAEKASQYMDYLSAISVADGPLAAFAFVSSASFDGFRNEIWVTESGEYTEIGRAFVELSRRRQ